jgi:hypothetical protein
MTDNITPETLARDNCTMVLAIPSYYLSMALATAADAALALTRVANGTDAAIVRVRQISGLGLGRAVHAS